MMVQDFTTAGGINSVVQILNRVDRSTENYFRNFGNPRS